jgi:hypothetical protein
MAQGLQIFHLIEKYSAMVQNLFQTNCNNQLIKSLVIVKRMMATSGENLRRLLVLQ